MTPDTPDPTPTPTPSSPNTTSTPTPVPTALTPPTVYNDPVETPTSEIVDLDRDDDFSDTDTDTGTGTGTDTDSIADSDGYSDITDWDAYEETGTSSPDTDPAPCR
ncbi:hypothetical protein SAZ11_15495 [Streptomyces sp. FXJ1.4098]|nr:hypothetical protein [Streptomyces sp. FXJ1.4098]